MLIQRFSKSINISFHIFRVPQIRLSDSHFTIPQHETYYIACNATGYPEPKIRWSKVGDEMGQNVYQDGSQLVITKAEIENRGQYLCFAESEYGTDQAVIIVDVDRKYKKK